MTLQTYKPQLDITMTEPALAKTRAEIARQGGGIGMRLGVAKSGCTGYMYTLDIAKQAHADDHVFKVSEDVCVVVDPQSLPMLQGTQIDYIKQGINAVFKFNNPNVQDQCGCGESFNIKESA